MVGKIAIFLSILISIVALIVDSKRKPFVKTAIWLPTVWFILGSSKPLSYWVNPNSFYVNNISYDYTSGSPIDRSVLIVLMCIALVVIIKRKLNWREIIKSNKMFFVVLLFMLLSILWADNKIVSLRRYFRLIGDFLMAFVILSEKSQYEALKTVIVRAGYFLIPLSIVLIKYLRHLGIMYHRWEGTPMWVGVASQKNSLGILASIVVFAIIIELIDTIHSRVNLIERSIQFMILVMSFILLIGSKSATSIGVFLIGMLNVIWLSKQKRNKKNIVVLNLLIFLVIFSAFISTTILSPLVALFRRNTTFTSRTIIWNELLRLGAEHPLFGIGYGSLWVGNYGANLIQKLGVNSAHNGYIEVYVQLGIFGLITVCLLIMNVFVNLVKHFNFDNRYDMLRLSFFMMIIIHNLMESSLLTSSSLWFLFIVVSMHQKTSLIRYVEPAEVYTF